MLRPRFFIALFTLIALSCGSAAMPNYVPLTPVTDHDCAPAKADLTVTTFNIGEAPGILPLYATPRLPYIAKAVAETDTDVMCIEEAWTAESVDALRRATGASPDQFFVANTAGENEDSDDTCGNGHLNALSACARKSCGDVPDEELAVCALRNCKASGIRLYLMHRSCLNCVVSQVGNGIDEIVRACTMGSSSRAYGGRNGIVMISRYPLLDREVIRFRSSNANRVALLAKVEVPGRGSVEVGCTHLSADAPMSPTHPDFDDWDDEKIAQLADTMNALKRRAHGRPYLLALDGNFGPGIGGIIDPSSPKVWEYVQKHGYASPAADMVPPMCTSCTDNLLRKPGPRNYLLDHVLVNQGTGVQRLVPVCAERKYAEPLDINAYGRTTRMNLSDHYGITVSFKFGLAGPSSGK